MSYLVVGMSPALPLVMSSTRILCPGSTTISAATHLLALQGDMSDSEVIATAFIAPHAIIWIDLIVQVADHCIDDYQEGRVSL